MEVAFVTCDVFTAERFGGNPLAVVLEAGSLTDDQMLAVAREFNYSETAFVLPASEGQYDAKVRIFTARAELPFAGHPNLGAALMLAEFELVKGDEMMLEGKAGPVRIRLFDTQVGRQAVLTAPVAPTVGATESASDVEAASGLPEGAITTRRHQPIVASAGMEFLFVELADLSHLERLAPSTGYSVLPGSGVFFYVKTGERTFRGRMFAPRIGVAEDPATGSAAAALAGLLATLEEADGDFSWTLEQGIEMGRPSVMTMGAERRHDFVSVATVAGGAVPVARGMIKVE